MTDFEHLLDYRRRVAEIYRAIRESTSDAAATHSRFCQRRDELFRTHPQSALSEEQKAAFTGLTYYPYDPAYRFTAAITPAEEETDHVITTMDGQTQLRRFGTVTFQIDAQPVTLSVYWIMGYGGGVFLPFRDQTNRETTYGGGRYLLDTIKHADLGHDRANLILDFNYAYNPSCAYHYRWVCPLAPRENWLSVPIPAGEQRFPYAVEGVEG
jgi:hypothetical protein